MTPSGENIAKWFVQSLPEGNTDKLGTTAVTVLASETADRRLGIAALVAERSREIYQANKDLERTIEDLEIQVRDALRPQIIVEGPTDQKILTAAVQKCFGEADPFCEFIPGEGAANVGSFVKTISRLRHASTVPIVGLVDNDRTGRTEYRQFERFKNSGNTTFRIANKLLRIYFGLLPVPEEFSQVALAITNIAGNDFSIPLSIEFMFSREIISEAVDKGVLVLIDRFATVRDGELGLEVNITQNFAPSLPEGYQYFAKRINKDCKDQFADWVCQKDEVAFGNFKGLLNDLREITDDGG